VALCGALSIAFLEPDGHHLPVYWKKRNSDLPTPLLALMCGMPSETSYSDYPGHVPGCGFSVERRPNVPSLMGHWITAFRGGDFS